MAYTTPRDWAANEMVSAALLNTHLRDNLLETAVAKVTAAGDIVYATGSNALARLGSGSIASGVANPKTVLKAADESVTSSIALQNDDELLLALLANEVWIVEMLVVITSTSAVPDFRFDFTVPAAAVGGYTLPYSSAGGVLSMQQGAAFTTITEIGIAANTFDPHPIWVYVANGANAGNLQFRWAQNTSDPTAATVKAGSYMRCYKVA